MFNDLTNEEKAVLDLLAMAERDVDFKELSLSNELNKYENLARIRLALYDKGYINLKVFDRSSNNIQTQNDYTVNGSLLTDYSLKCYGITKE
ncbi:MAG: hypothetical protein NC408_07375 [Candidatus Gastranaerophilales bacterium]|nr:hypothetical protein [Candidatus Gastranaerophilales bacterium]